MKRTVTRLNLDGITPGIPPTGKPEILWVAPTDLLVEDEYQRDLSPASLALIRRIVEGWDWRRFKPPIVARAGEGLEVIDGQHTAIAAATHGKIAQIPVVLVQAIAQTDRAQAFIGHARDRLAITAPQMHHAAVAAGDPEALEIERICGLAGVELLRMPPSGGVYRPRTTIAVGAVRTLILAEPEHEASWILRALADAGLAPVGANHMRALQHLISNEEFAEIDRDTLARAIQVTPIKGAEADAKEHAAVHRVPVWRGLAAVWFKAARKLPRRNAPRIEDAPRAPTGGTIAIPAWVPDDLVETYCNLAAADGEEAAATRVRRLKAQGTAA